MSVKSVTFIVGHYAREEIDYKLLRNSLNYSFQESDDMSVQKLAAGVPA